MFPCFQLRVSIYSSEYKTDKEISNIHSLCTVGDGGSITYTPSVDGQALARERDKLPYLIDRNLYPPLTRLRHIRHNGTNHYEYYVPVIVQPHDPGPDLQAAMDQGKEQIDRIEIE
jgi:hypothetical protein